MTTPTPPAAAGAAAGFDFHALRSPTELARLRMCQLSLEPRAPPANCFSKEYLAQERYRARVEAQEDHEFERFLYENGKKSTSRGALTSRSTPHQLATEKGPAAPQNATPGMVRMPHKRGAGLLTPDKSGAGLLRPASNYKPLSPITSFLSGYPGSPSNRASASRRALPTHAPPASPASPVSPSRRIRAMPTVVQMSYAGDCKTTDREDEISKLRSCVHSLESTVHSQAQQIVQLRTRRMTETAVATLALAAAKTKTKKAQKKTKPKKKKKSKKIQKKERHHHPLSAPTMIEIEKQPARSLSSSTFHKGKTGVFGRLWSGKKKKRSQKKNKRTSAGKSPATVTASFDSTQTRANSVSSVPRSHRRPFLSSELKGIADLYTKMAQFSLALHKTTRSHGHTQRLRPSSRRPLFWISQKTDCFPHRLTSSSSELARCDRHGDEHDMHSALELFFPRILSYLAVTACVALGAVSQHCLLYSHSVLISANRSHALIRPLEPSARCWKIVIDDASLSARATIRLHAEVEQPAIMEFRRLMQPPPALIDVMLALGALLCGEEELPWRYVRVDPVLLRRMKTKTYAAKRRGGAGHLDKPSLVGATWRDCQKIVQHVEEGGHLLTLLQRMERFDPDAMTPRSLFNFRNIVKLGILKPERAERGGKIGMEIGRWIQDTVKRALARFNMMQMGKSAAVRDAVAKAKQCVAEAEWHTRVRQRLNDGWFIAFFGWA
jgi:hypothetical protein